MKVGIVGIGLIGGSFAVDLRKEYRNVFLVGFDISPENQERALELGLIDKKGEASDWSSLDLVIVTVPVDAMLKVLPNVLDQISDDCLVMDAGSTKRQICEAVAGHPKRRNFLACHPIAGTEFSGPTAAHQGLYEGTTMIICEVEKTAFKLQERGMELINKVGMRVRYMNPEAHDKHIAYVSHLSHISSFMLGKTVIDKEENERDIFDLAGSGFESTVRLAKSSPDMWAPIFEQNKDNVLETLKEYIANLRDFKEKMEEGDFKSVYEQMLNTNRIKEILKGIPLTKTTK
ncbi:MAG: prephenate dehydrogenase [Flavobacteriaceae bacterium]|nr:prephenate dehydrogenase [Flavobacteriaceae bacterium]